ncbi:TIGR01777 family oxidoreductase [Pelagibius sp.]|uniref:TIGR01777 family oxidoreductase n=1 Tax=Pelagibius sp. TaxID=1931238 RepID=UPI0026228382|nr:TIGR01777 family oxidoreductase [Pelagibius sp.]
MTDPLLWSLLAVQILLGLVDTLYHHELTQRLAWRGSQRRELALHGSRNLLYAGLFLTLAWLQPRGIWAMVLIAVLLAESLITLWDFVEEDRTRSLPASERVLHSLMAINFGAILVLLLPLLFAWAGAESALPPVSYGLWSLFLTAAALGVFLFGLRDLMAARRAPALRSDDPQEIWEGGLWDGGLWDGGGTRRHILVTGGTGFIGRRLIAALVARGQAVTLLTRDARRAATLPTPLRIVTDLDQIDAGERIDAIVNLAGEPVASGLWTAKKKRRILRSRQKGTRRVIALIARLTRKPEVLVNASAIGWYGLRGDEKLRETDDGRPCFTQEVCSAWEREVLKARAQGVRVVRLRIGLVLGHEGGLLASLLPSFEFGLGARLGDGQQWMSWIERDDLVRLILLAIADRSLAGAVNGTAPNPARNRDFTKALGRALGRPAVLVAPARPLRILLGDFAEEVLLGGQRVLPAKAEAHGFVFRHPRLDGALEKALGRQLSWRGRETSIKAIRQGHGQNTVNREMF